MRSEKQLLSKDSFEVNPENWIKSGIFSGVTKKVGSSYCMKVFLILRVLIVAGREGRRGRVG